MSSFDHADHLHLALNCLREAESFDAAVCRIEVILRGKAAAAGHPEKYHHTLTVFWMRMVLRLLDQDLPLRFYSRDRLFSDAARGGWIEPDLIGDFDDGAAIRTFDSPRDPPHRAVPR